MRRNKPGLPVPPDQPDQPARPAPPVPPVPPGAPRARLELPGLQALPGLPARQGLPLPRAQPGSGRQPDWVLSVLPALPLRPWALARWWRQPPEVVAAMAVGRGLRPQPMAEPRPTDMTVAGSTAVGQDQVIGFVSVLE